MANPEVTAGDVVTIDLVDATIGTTVDLSLGETSLGSQTIVTSPARLLVTIPEDTIAGTHDLTLSSLDWNTDLRFELAVSEPIITEQTDATTGVNVLGWTLGAIAFSAIAFGVIFLLRRRQNAIS